MSRFMDYLNNRVNDNIEDDDDDFEDIVETVVEKPKVVKKAPIKKSIPQKVDSSVSVVEGRIRSKLDDIGLNSKVINEVVAYVLDNVSTIPNVKLGESRKVNTTQPSNLNEFKHTNDVRGAAEFLLDGVPDTYTPSMTGISNSLMGGLSSMSGIADHASSLL